MTRYISKASSIGRFVTLVGRSIILTMIAILVCAAGVSAEVSAQPAGSAGDKAAEKAESAKVPPKFLDASGKLDVEAVVKHFEDLYRSDSSASEVEMTTVKLKSERTLRMQVWTQGKEKVLIVIQSPPREQGTATLKVEKNLWNYLPRIKRTIRIPPSMMLASWM
ncbi:MAG: outer membrane lipoprotein-sorting protein [Candidatus Lindowbacteria bacterium]|nr:outer membrane lipoprotein-sorting protein [Candidatus Lindowbacteria bacterium]